MNLDIKKYNIIEWLFAIFIAFSVIFLFDSILAIGLLVLSLLIGITSFVIWKFGLFRKELFFLLLIVLVVHVGAVLFIHYADFQPFSGGTGDYTRYQSEATEIASRIHQGNFSLKGVGVAHMYPVIIGYLYALTAPAMLIGQLFNVWLSVLAIIFLYFIILEIYNSPRWGLIIGAIGTLHPSFVFFSSLLLKDILVIALTMAGMFVLFKALKNFSFKYFLLFYIILTVTIHLRFYIGFILAGVFILSWFFFSTMTVKKRIVYALFLIPILGTTPQISGHGYFATPVFSQFLNKDRITFYKEQVYQGEGEIGKSSSYKIVDSKSSFLQNSSRSLSFAFLGPFPWTMQHKKHLFVLVETIPWYFLYLSIVSGIYVSLRRHRKALPLFLFSMATIGLLALFFSNFGIISRIRIPAMLLLLGFLPLSPIWQKLPKNLKMISLQNKQKSFSQIIAGTGLYLLMLYLRVKFRLWSIIFKTINGNKRWYTKEVNGNKMLLDFNDKGISRELLHAGVREARSTKFIQTFLKSGEICFDIGANVGYYALQEARLVGEPGKIYTIEPSHENIEMLNKNIEANGYKNITTFRAAAGDENKSGEINLSQSSNRHSFLKAELDFSGETEKVDIITVDSFLKDKQYPNFVRMDVEGYETQIIRGMKGILAEKRPLKIFIELHLPLLEDGGRELLETLKDSGFEIKALLKEHFSMLTVESKPIIALHDFLFKKRYHIPNNAFENYDMSIEDFLRDLPLYKENVFEVFFERK